MVKLHTAPSPHRTHEILSALGGHWIAILICWPYPAAEAK